jgi:hypothetical protein
MEMVNLRLGFAPFESILCCARIRVIALRTIECPLGAGTKMAPTY